MRLKEDNSSWHARGIMCRDFRHIHGDPEISRHTGSNKKTKPRKRIDHKHVWTDWLESEPYPWWYNDPYRDWPKWSPSYSLHKHCTVPHCRARKSKKNPRYGYLSAKWNREHMALKASKEAATGR